MHCPTTAWDILQMIPSCFGTYQVVKTCLARSRPTPQDIFSRTLPRRPVSRNWWTQQENRHQRPQGRLACILSTVSIVYCWIMTYPNGFTANPPYFDVNSTRTPIALSLSYQSLTSLLHSISGSRTDSHHALANKALVGAFETLGRSDGRCRKHESSFVLHTLMFI